MSRLFDTSGADEAYDNWLTTTPEDRAHQPECNCERCHAQHIEMCEVPENARRIDYQCCKDELDEWIENGKWCPEHGSADMKEGGQCALCHPLSHAVGQ
jgi:hypothetical protein